MPQNKTKQSLEKRSAELGTREGIGTVQTQCWMHIFVFTKPFHLAQSAGPLQRCKTPPPTNEYPGYDNEQSDAEVPPMLELWEMRSTPSLPSLPDPLWLGVVALDRVLSMGQIELNCVLILNWITWNITVLTFKLCTYAKLDCLK